MDTLQPDQKTKRTEEEISLLIESWRTSGKSKKAFCNENNLSYMTFIGWSSGRKKEKQKGTFVPLSVKGPFTEIFAELTLEGGAKIIFHSAVSPQYLRAMLR